MTKRRPYKRPPSEMRPSKLRNMPALDGSNRKHKKMLLDNVIIPKSEWPNDLGSYKRKINNDR